MEETTPLHLTETHSVIRSTIRKVYTTNDRSEIDILSDESNRTLYFGITPDDSALLWLESRHFGRMVATNDPAQFAEFLAGLVSLDGIERTEYTRALRGRELFERVLLNLHNDLRPGEINRFKTMAARAIVAARNKEFSYAYVTIFLRSDWRVAYLPENADFRMWRLALAKLHSILKEHGFNYIINIDLADTPEDARVEIADEASSCLPVEIRQRVEAAVNEALEEWWSWAKKQNPLPVLIKTAEGGIDAVLAKIRESGVHLYAPDFSTPCTNRRLGLDVDWYITINGKELLAGGGWIVQNGVEISRGDFVPFTDTDYLEYQPENAYALMIQLGLFSEDEDTDTGLLQNFSKIVEVLAEESQNAWAKAIANYTDFPTFFASLKQRPNA